MCEGLLDFGFNGIYIDQYQVPTESLDHPDVNNHMVDMLRKMKALVKAANPENVTCANIMAARPTGKAGREFLRRTKIVDYGLTESENTDLSKDIRWWIEKTNLQFFILSHGNYESHKRKVEMAKKLDQPFCLFVPTPFDKADPRILKLYEKF